MRKCYLQMSLFDTYNDLRSVLQEDKPTFIQLFENHINFNDWIPFDFHVAFYRGLG